MRSGYWRFCGAAIAAVCCSCASTNDLSKDAISATGGGYYDEQVAAGLHYIVAKTTVGPLKNPSAARGMWKGRANRLCNGGYQQIELQISLDEPLPPAMGMPYLITVATGYALCASSPLSLEAATQALDEGARIRPQTPLRRAVGHSATNHCD